jgi:hypothetical protein
MIRGVKVYLGRILLFTLIAVNGVAVVGRAAAERIPEVHGTSFADQAVNLPQDLQDKAAAILVMGFSRGSRDAVTGWAQKIAGDYRTSNVVAYYELPMVASVPGLFRGILLRSIRSSTPERAHKRIVPITNNEQVWRALVHYGEADDAYLLVIDTRGDVVWQTHGQATDAAYAALKQQVEALKAKGGN